MINPISRQFRNAPFKRGTLNDIWEITRDRSKTEKHGANISNKISSNNFRKFFE